MARYHLRTKREAVDYALRHLVGQPLTKAEALAMCGSMPEFEVPEARFTDDRDHDDDPAR
jgi:Arc/MetJ family transcription regulator